MSTQAKFASHAEAEKAHWFSRRHKDGDAHREERQRQIERREKKAAGVPQNHEHPAGHDRRKGV